MSNNNIEIEIKLPLENPDEVKSFLNAHARSISKNEVQKDTYYVPAHRDFLRVKYPFEWLRIRESENGCIVAYKHFHPENVKHTDYCIEFETKIGNVEAMKNIFKCIDITEAVVVEKVRDTWMFEDVEVVIDEVKGLESYIELEATTEFANPQEGKNYLYATMKKLKVRVGKEDLRGYPYRLLEKKGYVFGQ